jgi:hypothetical protein
MKKRLFFLVILIFLSSLSIGRISFAAEKNVTVGYIDDYPLSFKNALSIEDAFEEIRINLVDILPAPCANAYGRGFLKETCEVIC